MADHIAAAPRYRVCKQKSVRCSYVRFSTVLSIALLSQQIKLKIVWECIQTLNKVGAENVVHITLVPGQSGKEPNDIAVKLSGKGSFVNLIGPELCYGLSKYVYKSTIQDWSDKKKKRSSKKSQK